VDVERPGRDAGPPSRRYPSHPFIGVGAVIVTAEGFVVLVQRQHEPLAGRWSLPGGAIELGESLRGAVVREVLEETGLDVDVGPIVDAVDHIVSDGSGRTEYHFVIADYLCRPVGGELRPGGDVDAVKAVAGDALDGYDLTEKAREVIRRGFELARTPGKSA
jgi:8-oxo-dGTP diphosphatase